MIEDDNASQEKEIVSKKPLIEELQDDTKPDVDIEAQIISKPSINAIPKHTKKLIEVIDDDDNNSKNDDIKVEDIEIESKVKESTSEKPVEESNKKETQLFDKFDKLNDLESLD